MNENFSILKRYGENYTDKEYITNPAIGRDEQIKELLLERVAQVQVKHSLQFSPH